MGVVVSTEKKGHYGKSEMDHFMRSERFLVYAIVKKRKNRTGLLKVTFGSQ